MDMEFFEVRRAFERGDPRPLAQWVLTHDMTTEQKEFVAKAICGDVEKIDGRKVKPLTDSIARDYSRLRYLNFMLETLDPSASNRLTDAKIARTLANKYGYQDADSVRRALNRYKKKIRDSPIVKKRVLFKEPGQEKK